MLPPPEAIGTQRLSLWPLREDADDFALYRALYCDPRVMRHVAEPVPATRIAAEFGACCRKAGESATFAPRWCVRSSHDEHRGVGLLGVFHDSSRADVELGIMLLPEAQARGFAREAMEAAMREFRTRADVARFWSRHRPANRPMARVLERLGFARGLDKDGLWHWERAALATPPLAADAAAL